MKSLIALFLFIFLPQTAEIHAQPTDCDELVQRGDTTICQKFKGKGNLHREHFYVGGKRIFSRFWRYASSGEYQCVQRKGKTPFSKMHGPSVRFYPDGMVKYYTVFYNGVPVNNCFSYYPSGAVRSICHRNQAGKMDGILSEYHENRQVFTQFKWENGRVLNIITHKDEAGNDLSKGTFKDGNGEWVYQEKGERPIAFTIKNGKIVKRKRLKA